MSELTRRPPHVAARSWLEPVPAMTRLSFRGGADAVAAATRGFGVELSTTACRASTNGTRTAWWLGPDEYLLVAPESEAAAVRADLAAALGELPHSIVDISHRHAAFRIKGPNAEWLMNSGCPLDLDPAAFPIGMCTRTVYMKSEIYLWRAAPDVFHVETWRSFTPYVVGLLEEAASECAA